VAGITTLEGANRFLREHYIAEFNRSFSVPAQEKGTAFRPCSRRDLDFVFSIQTECGGQGQYGSHGEPLVANREVPVAIQPG